MSWLQPDPVDRDYVRQLQKQDPRQYRLLRVLALAIRIEPLLLRNARVRYAPGSDIELETLVWFSSAMHSRNAKACILRGGIARALVDDLAQSPDQGDYQDAWAFIQNHTRHWLAQDQLEQQLRLAARAEDTAAVQNGLNKILNTLLHTSDAAGKRDLSRWLKGAVPDMLSQDHVSETAHLLFQYTAAALGLPAGWSGNKQAEFASMPQWLKDALPASQANSLGLLFHPGALQCVASGSATHNLTVKLPMPTPVLLHSDREKTPRWESLWLGKKIRLTPGYQWLTLQTLDGQLYRFSVSKPKPNPERSIAADQKALLLLYQPEDREQAYRIGELLKQQGIYVETLPEPNPPLTAPAGEQAVIRLWSRASASYWRQASFDSGFGPSRGLLLRTDPQLELPYGINPEQSVDWLDWQQAEPTEMLLAKIRHWLEPSPTPSPNADPAQEIETLLQELQNPETTPRRRLAIGDRLAELGDPRKGVGVREYRIIEYAPEVQTLLDELNDPNTPPPRRLEIGDRLAEQGDPRLGVGLDDNGLPDIDWVEIPAGEFIYGEGEQQQTIYLPGYQIGRYPVTNLQFQAFIDDGGYVDERWWQDLIKPEQIEKGFKQANRPREKVDWYEAVAYARWLSAKLGVKINLPTEPQWEKAARGPKGQAYPWGNEIRLDFTNFGKSWLENGTYYLRETATVGIYPQCNSPYQVADMAGNIREWCLNEFKKPNVVDVNSIIQWRALRGGSWGSSEKYLNSATSYGDHPENRGYLKGIRLVQNLN